ncbi:unnamed protein product, partial [Laminaria digitata]
DGVTRARVVRVGLQQGANRRRIQDLPLPTTEEVSSNTSGSTASRVPRRDNFYPARACDALRGRAAAGQRVQLRRQSEKLQRQRAQLQLQEEELELQSGQLGQQRL